MANDNGRDGGTVIEIVGGEEVARDSRLVLAWERDLVNRHIVTAVEIVRSVWHILCHIWHGVSYCHAKHGDTASHDLHVAAVR